MTPNTSLTDPLHSTLPLAPTLASLALAAQSLLCASAAVAQTPVSLAETDGPSGSALVQAAAGWRGPAGIAPISGAPTVQVVASYRRADEVLPLQPGTILSAEDDYRISVLPDRASHVHVYQIDATGQLFAIFPNPTYQPEENPLDASRAVLVPHDGWLRLDTTVGTEELVVLASVNPLPDPSSLARTLWNTDRPRRAQDDRRIHSRGPAPRVRRDPGPLPPDVFAYRLRFLHQ